MNLKKILKSKMRNVKRKIKKRQNRKSKKLYNHVGTSVFESQTIDFLD